MGLTSSTENSKLRNDVNVALKDSPSSDGARNRNSPKRNSNSPKRKSPKRNSPKRNRFVNTETEGSPKITMSPTSSAPAGNASMSTTSAGPVGNATMSETSPAPVVNASMSTTSSGPGTNIIMSETSAAPVASAADVTMSPTSAAPEPVKVGGSPISLDPSVFHTSEKQFNGGYTYAADLSARSEQYSSFTGGQSSSNVVRLDSSVFATSESQHGGEDKEKSEFNPEKFFNDMQVGGIHEPRNKEHKKKHLDKYLSPEEDDDSDDEDSFSFAKATEGLDVDENEDTEDLKQKVKALRMMVSRSSGKKSSKKSKKSRKAKRMTTEESSVGGANSISEYVNSTSSISTSDVRLISMNKMRKTLN